MEKSFQSELHPRDKHDRFSEKGVMELSDFFIVIDGYMSKVQKKNLNDAVYKNDRSKEVYVYLKRTEEFIKIK